jgi:hypothetical protein
MYQGFILVAITYLIVKHYVLDFTPLQTPWMFLNKGKYGHPGGVVHSLLHALVSAPVFLWCATWVSWWPEAQWHGLTELQLIGALITFEFFVHYHMDWFKVWFQTLMGWQPHTHPQYWNLLGIDQLVHYLTYVAMIAAWTV